jgi:hypothetical protein
MSGTGIIGVGQDQPALGGGLAKQHLKMRLVPSGDHLGHLRKARLVLAFCKVQQEALGKGQIACPEQNLGSGKHRGLAEGSAPPVRHGRIGQKAGESSARPSRSAASKAVEGGLVPRRRLEAGGAILTGCLFRATDPVVCTG